MTFALRAPKAVFFKLFMLSCFYIFACLQLSYYCYYKNPRYFNCHACSKAKPKQEHNNDFCFVNLTMYLIHSDLFNIYFYILRLTQKLQTKQIFIFYLHIFTLFLSYKSKSQHEYHTYNNLHIYPIYYTILLSNNLIIISIVINLYKISY